jgi:hypothetical protein
VSFLGAVPPWSWAEFLGWSVAGVMAGVGGLAFNVRDQGGAFDRRHRKALVAAIALGIVGGGGGVLFTWLFKLLGMS